MFKCKKGVYTENPTHPEEENALEWLEKACKERESYLTWIRVMPFDFLRIPDEPKYQDLLKKYGLEKYS